MTNYWWKSELWRQQISASIFARFLRHRAASRRLWFIDEYFPFFGSNMKTLLTVSPTRHNPIDHLDRDSFLAGAFRFDWLAERNSNFADFHFVYYSSSKTTNFFSLALQSRIFQNFKAVTSRNVNKYLKAFSLEFITVKREMKTFL